MRPLASLLLFALCAGRVSADPRSMKAHEARAAWAWISVQKAQAKSEVPDPEPCKCAGGYRCDCGDSCPCDGCPRSAGWAWSDEEGGYWWRPKPQAAPRTPAYIPVAFPSAPQSGGGGRACSGRG